MPGKLLLGCKNEEEFSLDVVYQPGNKVFRAFVPGIGFLFRTQLPLKLKLRGEGVSRFMSIP